MGFFLRFKKTLTIRNVMFPITLIPHYVLRFTYIRQIIQLSTSHAKTIHPLLWVVILLAIFFPRGFSSVLYCSNLL
jgi:hypothetical protein